MSVNRISTSAPDSRCRNASPASGAACTVEALVGQRLGHQFAEQRLVFDQQNGRFLFIASYLRWVIAGGGNVSTLQKIARYGLSKR